MGFAVAGSTILADINTTPKYPTGQQVTSWIHLVIIAVVVGGAILGGIGAWWRGVQHNREQSRQFEDEGRAAAAKRAQDELERIRASRETAGE